MTTAFIGLGSNLDDPVKQIAEAIDRLNRASGIRIQKISSLYCSPPMGPPDQPDFLNAVVMVETNLKAEELLQCLQSIETAQKRVRSGLRWGPRTIDLDILLFGEEIWHSAHLTIPHPGLSQRAFVVYPLVEIAPELVLPTGSSIVSLQQAMVESPDTADAYPCKKAAVLGERTWLPDKHPALKQGGDA